MSSSSPLPTFSSLAVSPPPAPTSLSATEKISSLAEITNTTLSDEQKAQLQKIFDENETPIAYDGVEPSGRLTLANTLLRVSNLRRLKQSGVHTRLLVADFHAMLNNKFGGDMKKINNVSNYTLQVWSAVFSHFNVENVEILLASEAIGKHPHEYWSRVLDIAGTFSVDRIQQCAPIMGRAIDDPEGKTNRILYPLMQAADSFLMKAHIHQMGADQSPMTKLVDEYIASKPDLASTVSTPVEVAHPLVLGLKQEQSKMSTTDPESAVYIDDSNAEINSKIKKAYCVPGEVDGNPILQYMQLLVFPFYEDGITVSRNEKNGGDLTFKTYSELETAYVEEKVHPADLKPCLSKYLNELVEPIRQLLNAGELKKLVTNVKKIKTSPLPDGDKLANLSCKSLSNPEPERTFRPSTLGTLDERYKISRSVGEECIQDQELHGCLEKKTHPIVYDGFEPSGRMHIAQGVLRTINVNKLTSAGAIFRFWVADWFAMLNSKMGGDLDKIQTVGKYLVEIWKSAGMDMTNVQFLWAAEEIIKHANDYWTRLMDIARRVTIARTTKCCTIMGRKEKSDMPAAQIVYPLMQCTDIFFLQADICQLGIDQRKINMLARDYCDLAKIKFKPVILSHHMLMGLKEGQEKMSKSDPESAIFMEDSAEDVTRKIANAFCPEKTVEKNPILDYLNYLIFNRFGSVQVAGKTYDSYETFEKEYADGQVSSAQAKEALTVSLNRILDPVREHFSQGEAKELLEQVRAFRITR